MEDTTQEPHIWGGGIMAHNTKIANVIVFIAIFISWIVLFI